MGSNNRTLLQDNQSNEQWAGTELKDPAGLIPSTELMPFHLKPSDQSVNCVKDELSDAFL